LGLLPRFAEFNAVNGGWIRDRKVQVLEESVPSAFATLFHGQNVGREAR
jgi:NADPH-dependent curcumin reductase CurA